MNIKRFKVFEGSDENSKIPEGFKYSWDDIYESLLYLTDIGFEIDEESKKRYLADSSGQEIKGDRGDWRNNFRYKSNVELAKNAIYEIKLFKKKETNNLRRKVSLGYGDYQTYYLDSDMDGLLKIYEEMASFCSHFDKSYHNLTIESDGYLIWLVVSSDVNQDFINKKLEEELDDRVITKIRKQIFNGIDCFTSRNKEYTKKFREDFFRPYWGDSESGIIIQAFDWKSISKGVYNTNSITFNNDIRGTLRHFNNDASSGYGYPYGRFGYKAEFRELKPEDCVNLKGQELERSKSYLGTKAIIIKFDYDEVFKKVKEELREEED